MDIVASRTGISSDFDRDGDTAQSGEIDTGTLESLIEDKWFSYPSPKTADPGELEKLLDNRKLKRLSSVNKLATVTALTALSISDFYKKEYNEETKPTTIWISGGGTNNQTLVQH
ncbi:MAG: anhydro-N-acetylmuramic acid kinase, partial [Bacillota bacterium]